ncbi:FeoB-associated Cys-rich membrane protein [Pedobacter yulinensis]|uniref:FeoB-associated Cys-rich membrane protein n=1 Tax=Pedobacter yulinensis TaxID=2126353 RepID=A0A2T3HQQ3_9SPHI|nr:FeoB-associated Cys-rich membrane protein [Pedobacter yulinensis]PST84790.1 FeoB-associated Cys-rich membrane protein [Pedobacter yulinensis]
MDIQKIIVAIIFALALFYIGRMVFRSLRSKEEGCGGNCKCGVDFSSIPPEKKK